MDSNSEIYCSLDPTTNEIIAQDNTLQWPSSKEDLKTNKGMNRLDKEHIYRIKAKLSNRKNLNTWYLTEVISNNEKNDILDNLLLEYKKEVSYEDEVMGKFILDKILNRFEAQIKWLDLDDIYFSVDVDNLEPNDYAKVFALAREFYTQQEYWDEAFKNASADELIEYVNDYQDNLDEDLDNITKEDFISRIFLDSISIDSDGQIMAYYNDDDMFYGHVIEIFASLDKGITTIQIAG